MKKFLISLVSLSLFGLLLVPSFSQAQADPDPNGTPSDCVALVNNLRYRDRDSAKNGEVSTLQDFLQSKGYLNSEPTGYFGLMTQNAVKAFQNANGIVPVSGYVGPVTRAKIKDLTCGVSTMSCAITNFTVNGSNSATVAINEGAWLSWNTNSCVSVSISGLSLDGGFPLSGSTQLLHPQTGDYILTAYGTNGFSTSKSVHVTVGTTTTPSITVLSPNGGETYTAGQQITVRWSTNNIPASTLMDIYVSIPQVGSTRLAQILNDGNEVVTLPTLNSWASMKYGKNFKIEIDRANFADSQLIGISADTFSINSSAVVPPPVVTCADGQNYDSSTGRVCTNAINPKVTVLSLNGGETVKPGDAVQIKWIAKGITGANNSIAVEIHKVRADGYYLSDVPAFYTTWANDWDRNWAHPTVYETGSYSWNIPSNFELGQYIVFIRSNINGTNYIDISNSPFTVASTIPTPAPVITSFTASPSTITAGQSTTVTYSASNSPSYCTLSHDGINSTSGATGTANFTPSVTTTYTVTCTNSVGSSSKSVTVTVNTAPAPVPVVTVTASPSTITAGGSATLSWTATNNPSYCIASAGTLSSTNGATASWVVTPTATTTYTVTCTNSVGSSSNNVTVAVNSASASLPVITFSASPTSITSGGSSTISYSVLNNISYCTMSGGGVDSTSGATGYRVVTPTVTATYTVTCYNSSGSSSKSVTVTVNTAPAPVPVVTVTASPSTITVGQSTTVTYSASNSPSYCTLSHDGINSTSGATSSAVFTPATTTIYTVTCVGATGGTISNSITVKVISSSSAPTAPTNFTARASSCGTGAINLSWSASTGATSYKVTRNAVVIYTGPNTSFTDTGLTAGGSYSYGISASNSVGTSSQNGTGAYAPSICTTPGFTLSANPTSMTSTKGDSSPFDPITISVNRTGGFTGAINLSFSNPGVNFVTNTEFPTSIPAGQSSVQFIAYPEGVANGTYHFDITGTSGSYSSTVTVYLTISSPISWISKPMMMANALGAFNQERATTKTPVETVNQNSSCKVTMTLSKGMNNEEVKCLQQKLNEKGFKVEGVNKGEETTLFGYNTMMAVRKFQANNKLTVDGVFGLSSRDILFK